MRAHSTTNTWWRILTLNWAFFPDYRCAWPTITGQQRNESQRLQTEIDDILFELSGDETRGDRNVFTPPSISDRVNRIVGSQWDTTSAPTQTEKDGYEWAADAFSTELTRLKSFASDLESFENQLEAAGAPWTPGRLPTWTKD